MKERRLNIEKVKLGALRDSGRTEVAPGLGELSREQLEQEANKWDARRQQLTDLSPKGQEELAQKEGYLSAEEYARKKNLGPESANPFRLQLRLNERRGLYSEKPAET